MRNFNLLDKETPQLPSGAFAGVESRVCYANGTLEGIRLSEKNTLFTHAGTLVPAYTETHRRKFKYSVEFYKSGRIKAVALDRCQEIQTPIGEFPAELVLFFETGELKRFFPLDGKIGGLWSEEEEKALAVPLRFELPFARFTAIIGGVGFHKNGGIRSITLFPGEVVPIRTPCGEIRVRNGFSLYASGELESLEPAEPIAVQTPIGKMIAFDPNAVGINADSNSLVFDKSGRVAALITVHNRIVVRTGDGRLSSFAPHETVNPLDDETTVTLGCRVAFDYASDRVRFESNEGKSSFSVGAERFAVLPMDTATNRRQIGAASEIIAASEKTP